jgi:predicted acyl esterase
VILRLLLAAASAAFVSLCLNAVAEPSPVTAPMTADIPAKFDFPTESYDYVKRTAMIPMRDGVKLYTVVIVPKGAKDAPILLTRTPYNAKKAQ